CFSPRAAKVLGRLGRTCRYGRVRTERDRCCARCFCSRASRETKEICPEPVG
ncbi:unnamed protein product, partial [Cladocopium goreaui]